MTAAIDLRSSSLRPVDSYRPPDLGEDYRLRQLMADVPLTGDGRFGCYRISDSSPYSDVARAVECTVFNEFFGNHPKVMTEAYAPYEAHSIFYLAVDKSTQQPAGALRVISNSASGLKTLNDIAEAPLSLPIAKVREYHGIEDLNSCWEVGTLAVLKNYRGQATDHFVSTMLYALCYADARARDIDHIVTVLDKHAYRQLTEFLGVPFIPIAGSEPFNYLGSESSRAAYVYMPEAANRVIEYMNGLDPSVLPLLRPYLLRLAYAEGLPKLVEVD